MSRAITAPGSYEEGSDYVTIAGLGTSEIFPYYSINYNCAVMVAGKGFGGVQHFGIGPMDVKDTAIYGYKGSRMNTVIIGAVATEGNIDEGASINEQLYAEFGTHLKTTAEFISISVDKNKENRTVHRYGMSSFNDNTYVQAILMSEIEYYGSIVYSSSGYDTGTAFRLPLFFFNRSSMGKMLWLRDVATDEAFCCNSYCASYVEATEPDLYIRPRFILGA